METYLRRHNSGSIPFGDIMFGGIPLGDKPFGDILFGDIPFTDKTFRSIPLETYHSARFRSETHRLETYC